MPSDLEAVGGVPARAKLGGKAVALILAFHVVAVAFATYPAITGLRSTLPKNMDVYQHLWVMKWYKTCLLEGRSVFLCPEIQDPTGGSLGNFSPLHIQSLLFVPLSFVINDDTIFYNIVWMAGLLLTGFGTTLLAWHLIGDRAAAAFAGLLAMLSAPMLIHASCHIELIWVGWFPIFMVWWMKFVDRPSLATLALAVLGFVLVAMSAAYFMVFAIFPAALYAGWSWAKSGMTGAWPWIRTRAPWFLGMIVLTLPFLLVLFSGHIVAIARGDSLVRSRNEFDMYGAPLWGYAVPTTMHWLGSILGFNPYQSLGDYWAERIPYLGVLTVALLIFAAAARSGLRRASFVWAMFALLVILSLGGVWTIGSRTISLPSSWLWDYFPIFRMTRVPSRICLFAAVAAAVLAGAGMRDLLSRLPGRRWRVAAFGVLSVVAVADLTMRGFPRGPAPEAPACYAFLKQRDPKATLLEIPFEGGGFDLNGECTYWQSIHRLATTSGYSGHDNARQLVLAGHTSPFSAPLMAMDNYLEDPARFHVELTFEVDFKDYTWLYLTANHLDYIVVHRKHVKPTSLARLRAILDASKVYEDDSTIVYARSLIPAPRNPVQLTREGWGSRNVWDGRYNSLLPESGPVMIYNPDPALDLTFHLDAAALRRPRTVRLRQGTTELARWEVKASSYQSIASPPFRLPAGVHELVIESQLNAEDSLDPGRLSREERMPQKLRVASVVLIGRLDSAEVARREREASATPTTIR
jgi:hypothetical protein